MSTGVGLPSVVLLASWEDLEAETRGALGLEAPERQVAVLHADDPVLLASSCGALNAELKQASRWALRQQAKFHIEAAKAVAMISHASANRPPCGHVYFTLPSAPPALLADTTQHRWLGALWAANLSFRADMHAKLGGARAAFSTILGLVAARVAPLPVALLLFVLKVESLLAPNRWLWIMVPGAAEIIDAQYDSWKKLLLGAEPWNNSMVARCERGWLLSGFGRVVGPTYGPYKPTICIAPPS